MPQSIWRRQWPVERNRLNAREHDRFREHFVEGLDPADVKVAESLLATLRLYRTLAYSCWRQMVDAAGEVDAGGH